MTATQPAARLASAVFWDMDGTLIDSEKLWDIAVERLLDRLGTPLTPEFRQSTLGNSLPDAMIKALVFSGREVTAAAVAEQGEWITNEVAELFAQGIDWMPGAQRALDIVAEAGIPQVLVTNTERFLADAALKTIGAERFVGVVVGDEVPRTKPHPDPYLKAAEIVGIDPATAIAVEDSPTGAAAAAAAGCTVLTVTHSLTQYRPIDLSAIAREHFTR